MITIPLIYTLYFLLAAVAAVLITPLIKKLALRFRILDIPNSERKIHQKPMPFLGGLALFLSFMTGLVIYLNLGHPNFAVVPMRFFWGVISGAAILMIGGILDDKYNLPPKILWLFPALASVAVISSGIGIGITRISNPFGSPIFIGYTWKLSAFNIQLSTLLVFLWMMGMIFTTKFLDGLDGLCSGVSLIAGLSLFGLSLGAKVNQPVTASLAIIFCGALFGYLFFAFNPASIFLGEEGSTFCGFMLGVLSIISGGKIATALLVMGIPILDVAWVIVRRLWYRTSPFRADRKHLHFRLLDLGFSQKQTVLILYGISALFGFTAIFLQSFGKLIALVLLFVVMLIIALGSVLLYKRRYPHISGH